MQDATVEQLIDVIEGNRIYVKCLYVYNKIDTMSIEARVPIPMLHGPHVAADRQDVDKLARTPDSVVISLRMNLNLGSSHRSPLLCPTRIRVCASLHRSLARVS